MLTIDNIEKIKQYSFDVQWTCDSINETPNFYHFIVERRKGGGKICDVKKITLCREQDYSISDYKNGLVYQLYLDDMATKFVVTADYIKDIINLVNTFTEILGNQYKPI